MAKVEREGGFQIDDATLQTLREHLEVRNFLLVQFIQMFIFKPLHAFRGRKMSFCLYIYDYIKTTARVARAFGDPKMSFCLVCMYAYIHTTVNVEVQKCVSI